ncbi:NPCBM/NEW2 domain-containing protein [Streptomyces sp. NPDC051183]|uniref:protein kinase domain-containing protein n=1 Tax=Streptomyces sp. NPDC051183 TaxID=3155165 RepID=UPI003426947D
MRRGRRAPRGRAPPGLQGQRRARHDRDARRLDRLPRRPGFPLTPSGRQVIHGDLSPGNVMVDAHGQATLVDFGLSKLTAEHRTAEVWFTPGYAAPEVFDGRRTPGTDRYAFGAIAYFLLSGQSPPATPGLLADAMAELPQIAALDPERRARVVALCAGDPGQRPLSLTAWVRDVRAAVISAQRDVQDAVPLPAPPPFPPPAAPLAAPPAADRRRPRQVIGAVAGVLVLAALAVAGVQLLGDKADKDAGGGKAAGSDNAKGNGNGSNETSGPPQGPAADGVSLTTLPVAKSEMGWLDTGKGTLSNQHYDTALVSSGPYKICDGSAEYDLGGGWKTLTMVAGVDDSSTHAAARINVTVDGSPLWSGDVRVGSPKPLSLDVTNGRRLKIAYLDPARNCGLGPIVLASPTLKR